MEDPGVQQVTMTNVSVTGGVAKTTVEPVHGNRMLYVHGPGENGKITVRWTANVLRSIDTGQGSLANRSVYMQPSSLVPIDGEAAALADQLGTRDVTLAAATKTHRIYDDVLNGMTYDKSGEGWGRGDFHHAVTVCKGNCTDFHARFIGTSRASGVPSRFTMGIPMKPTPTGTYNSYHCWAHWYDNGHWNPVDISEADKVHESNPALAASFYGTLDPHRISMSFGRDLFLEPRQSGAPLNYFVFPYAEANGQAIALNKDMWTFTWKDLP
jgi:transglutaminase-like putative cysteine protease